VFTDFIRLNKDYGVSSTDMRAAIGHELFHSLQEIYLPTGILDPIHGLWIKEASSTWFETVFVPGSCPGVMQAGYPFAWRGLFNARESAAEGDSSAEKAQNHGYGAAALLKHRTDASSAANDPFVHSIWSGLKAGNSELESLQNALGGSVPDFWTQFSKDYFTGKADCSTYQQFSNKAEIKDASTLMQTFNFGAYPLSSISFGLDLKSLTITDKTPLPITASGLTDGQTVFIYDPKSKSELGRLTRQESSYTIADITAFKGIVIVMTFVDANLPAGNYASTNEVTLTTGQGTFGKFNVKFSMTLLSDLGETPCGPPSPSTILGRNETVNSLNWVGTAFNGVYDHAVSGTWWSTTDHVEVSGAASSDFKTLTSLTWTSVTRTEETYTDDPQRNLRGESTQKMTLANLSQTSKSADGKTLVFSASGSDLSKRLTSVSIVVVEDHYNKSIKCITSNSIVDYGSTDNPPVVEITLSQP
jgi:hypothetical protein